MALARGQSLPIRKLNKKRILWILAALALTFGSACAIMRWTWVAACVSGWIGLPERAAEIPGLEREGALLAAAAAILPFFAALFLGFGGERVDNILESGSEGPLSYPAESKSEVWNGYVVRLGVSVLVTLGFVFLLFFVGSLSPVKR